MNRLAQQSRTASSSASGPRTSRKLSKAPAKLWSAPSSATAELRTATGTIRHIRNDPTRHSGLADDSILDLLVDSSGLV